MAANPTPESQDVLIALVEDMLDGLDTHEAPIGIKQNTKAALQGALAALNSAENAYALAKTFTAQKATLLRNANAAGDDWLTKAAKVLRMNLGERWNAQWEATQFPNGSTQVPATQDLRFTLLGKLKTYFTANPAKEAPNQGVTAAAAATLHAAISDARDALAQAQTDQNSAKNARDAADRNLRKRARGLIEELGDCIGPDDPRWDAFGLSRPSDPDLPLPASALTLTPAGPGALLLKWKRGKRATRYRLFVRVLTVDPDFSNVATLKDLSHTLQDLPTGKTVEAYIIAANEAGEADPTGVVSGVAG